MAIVLTRPLVSDSSNGYVPITGGTIPSGNTSVIDTVDATSLLKTVKWIVEVTDIINEKINSYEIMATNHFDNDITFNRYGIVGNRVNHGIDVVLNVGDMVLQITNHELVNIDYKITRLEVR